MKYNITNIQWDTDGRSPKKLKLPFSTIIDVPGDVNPEDFIADHLSDTYGFCVEGYNYEPDKPDVVDVVKALGQYRQLNINWWQDPKKTAERLQDFIGKEPLAVAASGSETKTPSENTVTVTLTATQQRQIIDCLFDEKKRSGMGIAKMSPDDRVVMAAYIESIDAIVKALSA